MQHKEIDCAMIDAASSAGISGAVTAGKSNLGLRIGNDGILGRVIRYGALGMVIALVPLQQALAERFIPSVIVSSTVPPNGDGNPYGVAFVPTDFPPGGPLNPGDILVSNFNNSVPIEGTGTTIVRLTPNSQVAPSGSASVFFQGTTPPPLGLTTALGVLKSGFVLVGSVPTTDGTFKTIQPGSLLILDRKAKIVATLTKANLLDSPWDLTIFDEGDVAKAVMAYRSAFCATTAHPGEALKQPAPTPNSACGCCAWGSNSFMDGRITLRPKARKNVFMAVCKLRF